jgi:hypothetical protein
MVLTSTPWDTARALTRRKSTGPWLNGSLPAMKTALRSAGEVLQRSWSSAAWIAVPQYSSPPEVVSANSSS